MAMDAKGFQQAILSGRVDDLEPFFDEFTTGEEASNVYTRAEVDSLLAAIEARLEALEGEAAPQE